MSAAKSLRRSPRQLLRELIDWARNLAYVREMVDQELLARNEYLAAENRILKAQLRAAVCQY